MFYYTSYFVSVGSSITVQLLLLGNFLVLLAVGGFLMCSCIGVLFVLPIV